MTEPTPGCFFACWNMVLIIFISLPQTNPPKKKEKLTVKGWWRYPYKRLSISADYYKEELASLSTVCWPAWRNLLPVYPVSPPPHPPSCWINERVRGEWEEGSRAGETVLIHIMTSVEDTVCFHWGSPSTLCPKVFCCTTTKLQILNTFFFLMQQIETFTQTFPPEGAAVVLL